MKILIYQWKAYNYLDIIKNLELMGHYVETLEYSLKNYDEDQVFSQLLTEKIKSGHFDFVFTVNYFPVISNVCEQLQVKYVIWTCDNPLISMYHRSVYNSCNYLFLFDHNNYLEFSGMGVKHIWHLPLAVDTGRIQQVLEEASDLEMYKNQIAFVGSLYERNSYDRLSNQLPEYLKGYFEAVIRAQMEISGGNIIASLLTPDVLMKLEQYYHLEKNQDSMSDLSLIFSTTVLGFKVAAEQRKSGLLELGKKYQTSIYSNSNTWELLGVDNRGSVDYWTQMPKVFQQSRINLNFTIPNIPSGIPLRVWDILGSGGFLLTNYQPELLDFFENGKDLVIFEGEKDLVEKAGYYLSHEKQRKEIARRGKETVAALNTYSNRLNFIINKIKDN